MQNPTNNEHWHQRSHRPLLPTEHAAISLLIEQQLKQIISEPESAAEQPITSAGGHHGA